MNPYRRNFYNPIIFFFFYLSFSLPAFAQIENPEKRSPLLKHIEFGKDQLAISPYLLIVKDSVSFHQLLKKNKIPIRNLHFYDAGNIASIDLSWAEINSYLLESDIVLFIDKKRKPVEEMQVKEFDLSANKVSLVHKIYPQWNGDSLTVSVKEHRPDTGDIDFKGRYINTLLQSSSTTTHATLMATMIAGGGNTFYNSKGVAWKTKITSSDFNSLLPDPDVYYQQQKITVQNHSYGTGIENYYGADAMAYDISTINNPGLLHVFSSGNAGTSSSQTGLYQGMNGFANLTGSFKMAKNILTVGAVDPLIQVPLQSSRGPAYDGRIKPELVAFGIDGSSGSAAVVSGIALMLQQAYKNLHHDSIPSSALIKAALINSADDINTPHPDFISGYGNANAYKALQTISKGYILKGAVADNEEMIFKVQVPQYIKELKMTLVWNDLPAVANATKALINDLDLKLISGAEIWQPWVLNHFPHKDSLLLPAERKQDTLNNVEQVTIEFPNPGEYTINIRGNKISGSPQRFYIVYQFDSADYFTWYSPIQQQNLLPGEKNIIRWESGYTDKNGKLEYSLNETDWHLISDDVDLSKGLFEWQPPDTIALASLKMEIDGKTFESDRFGIVKEIKLSVGFHCQDSILLYWENIEEANEFQVFSLESNYLEPVMLTNDTFVVLSKTDHTSLHFAVAPVIESEPLLKSVTVNYTTQGVDCYFKSFLGGISNNEIQLQLNLGSLYNIAAIDWEKLTSNGFERLYKEPQLNQSTLTYNDTKPLNGVNTYRVKIILMNGQVIYSEPITIYYVDVNKYRVYPNPVDQSRSINIIARQPDIATMQVFNSAGILMLEKRLDDVINIIPAGILSKGFYIIRIISDDGITFNSKLVVQ